MKILKIKKRIYAALSAIILITGISFLQSCSNDEVMLNSGDKIMQETCSEKFLTIANIKNRQSFTNSEKAIYNEAQKRVSENLKRNNGYLSLEHVSAAELNMDKDLFKIFADLYAYAEINKSTLQMTKNKKLNSGSIRLKVGSEINPLLPPLTACEIAYGTISTQLNSKEQVFFNNYWNSNGNMNLTTNQMSDIVNCSGRSVVSSSIVTIGNTQYTAKTVSYYGTEYKYAFGTATEYYNGSGQCVGFKDTYDFNAASRDWKNETITRAVGTVGTLCGASNYEITYGTHP